MKKIKKLESIAMSAALYILAKEGIKLANKKGYRAVSEVGKFAIRMSSFGKAPIMLDAGTQAVKFMMNASKIMKENNKIK